MKAIDEIYIVIILGLLLVVAIPIGVLLIAYPITQENPYRNPMDIQCEEFDELIEYSLAEDSHNCLREVGNLNLNCYSVTDLKAIYDLRGCNK